MPNLNSYVAIIEMRVTRREKAVFIHKCPSQEAARWSLIRNCDANYGIGIWEIKAGPVRLQR